jgi:hypothetical protein
MLGLLGRLAYTDHSQVRLWTLGGPGECAMQTRPCNAIILGELNEAQCRALAGRNARPRLSGRGRRRSDCAVGSLSVPLSVA